MIVGSGTMDAFLEIAGNKAKNALDSNCIEEEEEEERNIGLPDSALTEIVHRYCQHLPQDEYCVLTPHFIFR